jgi:Kef-type K+ transport system membrane component KefB/nucleotide-binding universal stress UspA family protein
MTFAAGLVPLSHEATLLFLSQLALLLGVARLFGEWMRRLDQPAVIGELLAGLLLGPSVLGFVAPGWYAAVFPADQVLSDLLSAFSLFCVLLLLIVTGLEIDLSLIVQRLRTAAWVSAGGLVVPFAFGLGLGAVSPAQFMSGPDKRVVFSLFVAVNLSISAIPVIAKTLKDLKVIRRDLGQLNLAAAMLDDAVGWILLAVAAGLATKGQVTVEDVGLKLLASAGVMGLALTLGRGWVNRFLTSVDHWSPGEGSQLGAALFLALAFSILTHGLGLESMLGAFLAGILIGQSPRLKSQVAHTLELFTSSFCAPIFFATAGLKVNLPALFTPSLLAMTAVVLVVATLGKYIGCYLGGRVVGLSHWQCLTLGSGMNPRGAMGVIVARIGLSLGILNQDMYSVMIAMAIITSLAAPPMLRWTFRNVPVTPEEQDRLSSEMRRAESFLNSLRRVLLPSRGGHNVEVAAHLLGHLSHHHPVAITAMFTSPGGDPPPAQAAEAIALQLQRSQGPAPKVIHCQAPNVASSILQEAEKGSYDLLVMGATRDSSPSPVLNEVLRASPCPTFVVQAQRAPREGEEGVRFQRILLPVVGTNYSLRATEVAAVIARSLQATVLILHVVPPLDGESHGPHAHDLALAFAQQIVDHHADLARKLGAQVDTQVLEDHSPSSAILGLAAAEQIDLIFMATGIRPVGGQDFLGHRAERVLSGAPCAAVVMSS